MGDLLFRCPCYAEDEATLLNPGDPRWSRPQGRIYYGVCYIIWPAVASFFLGTHFYRPQRSCGQGYVFTRVCDSVHGGVSTTPPGPGRPPRDQTDPPWTRQTPPPGTRQTPPPRDQADTPATRQITPPPHPREEDCSIRSMSGRYASYWNAFLFFSAIYSLIK